MPTIFENSNHYKVIVLSPEEMRSWPRATVCDRCESRPQTTGFYIAARNQLFCAQCYEEWCIAAQEKKPEQDELEKKHLGRAILQLNVQTRFLDKSDN